jgi:Ni,Fe-hydrogenase III large subunit
MTVIDQIAGTTVAAHRPWPRRAVDETAWRGACRKLSAGELTLMDLFADGTTVHMVVLAETTPALAVLSLATNGSFPSVGAEHPPAIRLERALRDLSGLVPQGMPDPRPWLDHGAWRQRQPPGFAPSAADRAATPYAFLTAEGEHLHQVPVGPIHAGIIEPGHFRFTASGETVVRLEQRFGYVHKGIESLMQGATIEHAARLAGRASGDSTVAYGLAFARAVEAALQIAVPARAQALRGIMAELERLANHLGDIGAICNDASFSIMHAHCGILRERVLRAAQEAFGHRLMMDCVRPGGVAADLDADGTTAITALIAVIRHTFPRLVALYDGTASLQDRTVTTGIVRPDLARRFGAGGHVGRASGRGFDARKALPYPPYDRLAFEVPVLEAGDVNARVWIRIKEVEQSLALLEALLRTLPAGPVGVPLDVANANGEGLALVESFRGDVLAFVRIADGAVARCRLRDPSWFQWPLLEAAIEGNIIADFPICNKSFNCSYSGHDL